MLRNCFWRSRRRCVSQFPFVFANSFVKMDLFSFNWNIIFDVRLEKYNPAAPASRYSVCPESKGFPPANERSSRSGECFVSVPMPGKGRKKMAEAQVLIRKIYLMTCSQQFSTVDLYHQTFFCVCDNHRSHGLFCTLERVQQKWMGERKVRALTALAWKWGTTPSCTAQLQISFC